MLLDDIASYLQTQGIGTVGTDIFKGWLPDTPDNCIVLYEYGGPVDLTWKGEEPRLQVRVRNSGYAAGRDKMESVYLLLHKKYELVIDGTRYLLIRANHSPEWLRRDENNRDEWVVNFTATKERSA